jgi:methionine synthase II (cobalamin-independent)
MSKLKGLATGIGSLPHKDAQEALDLIFKYTPQIPFWPQLPKIDMREAMTAQFIEGFPCLKLTEKGVFFDPQNKEKQLERFYDNIINRSFEEFRITKDYARGLYAFYERLTKSDLKHVDFIKCHITGPFTFAASINDERKVSLLYDPVFMQAIINGLAMKALWQIKFFEKFAKIILFIDEPYLGCFGSAYTPINRENVIKGLEELTANLKKSGKVLIGVHCCGNTDWSIFTEIKSLDIISFDAFNFLEKLVLFSGQLKSFLERGGILCWGVVPTQEFSDQISLDSLKKIILAGIEKLEQKGIQRKLLLENLLLSPSCGLATEDLQKTEKIFRLLSELSSSLQTIT